VKNDLFFIFKQNRISSYLIKDDKAEFLNSTDQINIDKAYSEIIDLNNFFYLVNNKDKIYILNKNNLNVNKTININLDKYNSKNNLQYFYSTSNNYFTSLFKITDKIIVLFIFDNKGGVVDFQIYQISSNGIKWELKKEENILRNTNISLKRFNNKLLFLGEDKSFLIKMTINGIDIKNNNKENDIKKNNKENEGYYSYCTII